MEIRGQIREWIRLGHEVLLILLVRDLSRIPVDLNLESCRIINFHWLRCWKLGRILKDFRPNILYVRYQDWTPFLGAAMSNYPSVIELNSRDVPQRKVSLKRGDMSKKAWLRFVLTRGLLLDKAAAFVAVTREIGEAEEYSKFEKPMEVIPNSIDLSKYSVLPAPFNSIPRIGFMGVNTGSVWHGVDLIEKLAKATVGKLNFSIIGSKRPDYEVSDNIEYFPRMPRQEYEKVIESCDVAISTAAMFREGFTNGSPLKVREYLAFGLPTILPHTDSMFDNRTKIPDWILEIENKEGELLKNIDKIIDFCNLFKSKRLQHDQVAKYIDVSVLEKKRLNFISDYSNID